MLQQNTLTTIALRSSLRWTLLLTHALYVAGICNKTHSPPTHTKLLAVKPIHQSPAQGELTRAGCGYPLLWARAGRAIGAGTGG